MKVITLNANGIRAAARKGFFTWFEQQDPDFVCIQETKAQVEQLTDSIFKPAGYNAFHVDAVKRGYSGVLIYSKQKPDSIQEGFGWQHISDEEGRYLQLNFGDLSISSIYLPSGTSSEERQQVKFEVMRLYEDMLQQQIASKRRFIICGDFNIVHKEIDIKNFKSNQKTSGCLPEERAWINKLFVEYGLVDAFREVNQQEFEYTWWSNRGRAWENNVGWRIDYQIVTPNLKQSIKDAFIYRDARFSDHAPLVVEYI